MNKKIAAVVLAAGGSSRLGEPKQLLKDVNGETLVHRSVRDAIGAGATPILVVVGARALQVTQGVQDLIESGQNVIAIENAKWATGISSSIQVGVQFLQQQHADVEAILILTCDMPSVGVNHLKQMSDIFSAGAVRVASAYENTRGIPAIIPREEFGELLLLSGDRGAKTLLENSATAVVELSGGQFDLDTPKDVASWRAQQERV